MQASLVHIVTGLVYWIATILWVLPLSLWLSRSFPVAISICVAWILNFGVAGIVGLTLGYQTLRFTTAIYVLCGCVAIYLLRRDQKRYFFDPAHLPTHLYVGFFTLLYLLIFGEHKIVNTGDILSQIDLANYAKLSQSLPTLFPLTDQTPFHQLYPPGLSIFAAIISDLSKIPLNDLFLYFWYLSLLGASLAIVGSIYLFTAHRWISLISGLLAFAYPFAYSFHEYGMPQKLWALIGLFLSLVLLVKSKRPVLAGLLLGSVTYLHTLYIFIGGFWFLGAFVARVITEKDFLRAVRHYAIMSLVAAPFIIGFVLQTPVAAGVEGAGGGIDHVIYNFIEALNPFYSGAGVFLFIASLFILSLIKNSVGAEIFGAFLGAVCLSHISRFYALLNLPWYREWVGNPHHNRLPTNIYYSERLFPFFTHHILMMNSFNIFFAFFIGTSAVALWKLGKSAALNWGHALLVLLGIGVVSYCPQFFPIFVVLFLLVLWRFPVGQLHLEIPSQPAKIAGSIVLICFALLSFRSIKPFFQGANKADGNSLVGNNENEVIQQLIKFNSPKKILGTPPADTTVLNNPYFGWWIGGLTESRTLFTRALGTPHNMIQVAGENYRDNDAKEFLKMYKNELTSTQVDSLLKKYDIEIILWPKSHSREWKGPPIQVVFENDAYKILKRL